MNISAENPPKKFSGIDASFMGVVRYRYQPKGRGFVFRAGVVLFIDERKFKRVARASFGYKLF